MKRGGLSLRIKLLAALTIIPMIGLSLFLWLAVSIFQQDKTAYIFDSSLSVSKTRAARVNAEIIAMINFAQAVVLSYRADTKNLTETGTYYFEREQKFEAFQVHAFDPTTGGYEKIVDLAKDNVKDLIAKSRPEALSSYVKRANDGGVWVDVASGGTKIWLAARFGDASDPKRIVALTLFEASDLAQVFADVGPFKSFLSRKQTGQVLLGETDDETLDLNPTEVWAELGKSRTPEGIGEITSAEGRRYLGSFAEAGIGDLVLITTVDRAAAFAAIEILLRKSTLFFIAVLSLTAIIAVLASRRLTSALSRLSSATQKVAEGDFGVRVEVKAKDEIGLLAKSFNKMAEEVSRLMKETAEKARMESELATAKAVQETLFPESNAIIDAVSISGHYQPASECGGDWWHYCENGDKVYIWIGDATGHGAPAALLTSAARAVASVISFGPPLSAGESLGILNRAICETSKGKMMMTFFLAVIDKHTGEMNYANASHEPPLLLHAMDGVPSRDDFLPLNDVNNPRLGEQHGAEFKEATIQLKPGDRVVFYTDGVVDVKSPEGKTWGERRFLKALAGCMSESPETKDALGGVVDQIRNFRLDTPLDDDVTLILASFAMPNVGVGTTDTSEAEAQPGAA